MEFRHARGRPRLRRGGPVVIRAHRVATHEGQAVPVVLDLQRPQGLLQVLPTPVIAHPQTPVEGQRLPQRLLPVVRQVVPGELHDVRADVGQQLHVTGIAAEHHPAPWPRRRTRFPERDLVADVGEIGPLQPWSDVPRGEQDPVTLHLNRRAPHQGGDPCHRQDRHPTLIPVRELAHRPPKFHHREPWGNRLHTEPHGQRIPPGIQAALHRGEAVHRDHLQPGLQAVEGNQGPGRARRPQAIHQLRLRNRDHDLGIRRPPPRRKQPHGLRGDEERPREAGLTLPARPQRGEGNPVGHGGERRGQRVDPHPQTPGGVRGDGTDLHPGIADPPAGIPGKALRDLRPHLLRKGRMQTDRPAGRRRGRRGDRGRRPHRGRIRRRSGFPPGPAPGQEDQQQDPPQALLKGKDSGGRVIAMRGRWGPDNPARADPAPTGWDLRSLPVPHGETSSTSRMGTSRTWPFTIRKARRRHSPWTGAAIR
jgi:hypothetical protein